MKILTALYSKNRESSKMKKNYYVIAVIFCFFYLHSTQIGVQMVSCIKDIPKEFDVVIIGENEQKILSGSILRDYTIGALYKRKL